MNDYREDLVDRILDELETLGGGLDVDLRLDEEGACYFEHDDGWHLAVMLVGEDQVVAAVSILSEIESPSAEVLARTLTEFNWLGARTDGAALSWNPRSKSFLLWRSLDGATMTASELNATLLRLVGAAAEVQKAVMAQFAVAGAQAAIAEPAPAFGQRV